jgi:hypothetical protein
MNISSMLRQGWEPVKASDHPEIYVAGVENERFKDNVIIGGLMLCKAPAEMVEDRNEYFQVSRPQIKSTLWITTSCARTIPVCRSLMSVKRR